MFFVVLASILLQLCAAGLALRLIGITRHRLAWGFLCTALLMMALRRIVSLHAFSTGAEKPVDPNGEFIALSISVLLVVGMYMLGPLFRSINHTQQALADQLEERRSIARKLHDTLGQSFAGVLLQLEAADAAQGNLAKAETHRERARKLAQSGLHEARDSMLLLRQPDLESANFRDVIQQLADRIGRDYEQPIQVESSPNFPELLPLEAAECFRILQESMLNAVRHSGSNEISVRLTREGHQALLEVQDSGVGLGDERASRAGFGLISMRERADRIGAQLDIQSSPQAGTLIQLRVRT